MLLSKVAQVFPLATAVALYGGAAVAQPLPEPISPSSTGAASPGSATPAPSVSGPSADSTPPSSLSEPLPSTGGQPPPGTSGPAPSAGAGAGAGAGVAPKGPRSEPADRLTINKEHGFFQLSALLQVWAFMSQNSAVNPDIATTFRIRRAEVKIKGEIVPGLVEYGIVTDAAKLFASNSSTVAVAPTDSSAASPGTVTLLQPGSDGSILQDAYVTVRSEYVDVSAGQFKIPVSLEGSGSSSKVLLPERATVSRTFGDKRDIGVKLEKKLGQYFDYSAGVYNGSGPNHADADNPKDLGLRLEVYPIEGLTLGGVGYLTAGKRKDMVRDRVEGDLRYNANDVLIQAEYIHGWDGSRAKRVESHGAYGALGYTLFKQLQPIVRIGFYDPNVETGGNSTNSYEGGINYYLSGQQARLSLSVAAFDPQTGKTRWEGTLAAQASF